MKPLRAICLAMLDLVLPAACMKCGNRLASVSDVVCTDCMRSVRRYPNSGCVKCGAPLDDEECLMCSEMDYKFSKARAPYVFDGTVRDMVHDFKYNAFFAPIDFFTKAMQRLLEVDPAFGTADLLTDVPMHTIRHRERGYNQAKMLAQALSKASGIPFVEVVKRRVNTPTQTTLGKTQRGENLRSAFRMRRRADVSGKRVILVDDVFTTGSTANEISSVLLEAGAAEVLILTASRAI